MRFLEIRQCFELYARKNYIEKEAQLRFIMRSLGHVCTNDEVKEYMRKFGKNFKVMGFLN